MSRSFERGWQAQFVTISKSGEIDKSTLREEMASLIYDYIRVGRVWWVDPQRGDSELNPWLCMSRESLMSRPSKRGWWVQFVTMSESEEFDELILREGMTSYEIIPRYFPKGNIFFIRKWEQILYIMEITKLKHKISETLFKCDKVESEKHSMGTQVTFLPILQIIGSQAQVLLATSKL